MDLHSIKRDDSTNTLNKVKNIWRRATVLDVTKRENNDLYLSLIIENKPYEYHYNNLILNNKKNSSSIIKNNSQNKNIKKNTRDQKIVSKQYQKKKKT